MISLDAVVETLENWGLVEDATFGQHTVQIETIDVAHYGSLLLEQDDEGSISIMDVESKYVLAVSRPGYSTGEVAAMVLKLAAHGNV